MENGNRFISPALFGIILVCFLLPFMSISCGRQEIGTLSGMEMAFGTEIEGDDVDALPPATWALTAAVFGLAISFWNRGKVLAALSGLAGFGSLMILQLAVNEEMSKPGNRGIDVTWTNVYYVVLLLFLGVAIYNIYLLTRKKAAQPLPRGQDQTFCTSCGSPNSSNSQFCTQCGAQIINIGPQQ